MAHLGGPAALSGRVAAVRDNNAEPLNTTVNKPEGKRKRVKSTPKGRRVDPQAREDVRALLGDEPRRRDLLIEHLHRIQDRYGHLSAAHLVALADEMKLAMTEVYEVATFYHHFDVV
jgi:NADH:ubiquinone oxidoreductase subunit E